MIPEEHTFHRLMQELSTAEQASFPLAAFDDFLVALPAEKFGPALATRPEVELSPYLWNYTAAMIEQAAHQKQLRPPAWVHDIPPLDDPVFYTDMLSLRLHLLLSSPVPFRRRNIFIDTGIGGRV